MLADWADQVIRREIPSVPRFANWLGSSFRQVSTPHVAVIGDSDVGELTAPRTATLQYGEAMQAFAGLSRSHHPWPAGKDAS